MPAMAIMEYIHTREGPENSEDTFNLGPGIVREKTLGGVTSFVPFSCQ